MKLNDNERYEVKAEAFRAMTGHMAPGKDASAASQPASCEEREAAWKAWNATYFEVVRALLLAVERTIDGEE